MDENLNILGCYVSSSAGDNKGALFRTYIWGEKGISDVLRKLKYEDYGRDIIRILVQFYVNPIPYLLPNLKEVGSYRKNEKSISVTIIVNDENFFNKSEEKRYVFLKQAISDKLNSLEGVVRKRKMDTRVDLLKSDLQSILKSFPHDATAENPPA